MDEDLFVSFKVSLPLILVSIVFLLPGCADKVSLLNSSDYENGILVDGQYSEGFQNDKTFVTNSSVIKVGRVNAGANNEVIAFTKDRTIALEENVSWTNADNDIIDVQFANTIGLRAKVWIVKGPFNTQRQKAINAYISTASIWENERMGLEFNSFEIVDATSNPKASNYYDFYCSKQSGIENDIGKVDGIINIYYVNRVGSGSTSVGVGMGWSCKNNLGSDNGGDVVAMGSATGDELLAHELGHSFALEHTNGMADYDQTNAMHNASNTRQYFTEGQTFRAHILPYSAINDANIYNARPGKTTRNCRRDVTSNICVKNNKRIWADGAFPAN
jgi:hypothetical protein